MNHQAFLVSILAAGALAQSSDSLTPASTSQPRTEVGTTAPVGWWSWLGRDSLPRDSLQKISVNVGVMPGSDANGKNPKAVANAFSLSLVSAEAGAVEGLQLSGGMNDVHGSVGGIQASMGLNIVGGNVIGVQGSSVNLVHGGVQGVQYGALLNRVGGNVQGWQIGVLGNLVEGEVVGVQSGSVVNKAKSLKGLQDGSVNISDRVRGLQLGLVNVADDIGGAQFGLVNIADSMTGPQIGLVNIRPDSRVFVEGWTDESGLMHVGLNYGSPGWYTLLDFATRQHGSNRVALGWGIGGRMPSERLILSFDMSTMLVVAPDELDESNHQDTFTPKDIDALNGLFRVRATVGWHFWRHLAVFAGASWNILAAPDDGFGTLQLRPYRGYHWDADANTRMWPGAFVGIRI